MTVRSTYSHARSNWYERPGGPWDVPALDVVLSAIPATVVDGERRLSGIALEQAVGQVAGWLEARGVGHGDAVSWQLPNVAEAWLLYRACWRVGAVAAPLHHAAGRADVDAAVAQASPAVFVTPADAGAMIAGAGPSVIAGAGPSLIAGPVDPAAPAAVLFTSGSSGRPKAVVHTHRGLVSKARTMVDVHGLGPDDVVLMPAPMAHISGLLNGLLVPGAAGMTVVLMSRWEPSLAVDLIERERVTFMIGPPTFFVSLMDAPGFSPPRVSSLRLVSSGGAGVTPAFVETASSRLGCRVKRTYGSTEAPTVTTSAAGDPEERARETDGRPTGEAEVGAFDPASGARLRPDDVGEIWVRGPEVCEGYLDPVATAAAFTDDGWLRTGDLGTVDTEGWLTITGRIKDVIIRGGENISAAELEAVLEAHPDIRHAAVVGYPDERLGHRVCAYVVGAPGAGFDLEACRAWMSARGVTRFKWPERLVQVDALPILAAGKIDRAALERRAAESVR